MKKKQTNLTLFGIAGLLLMTVVLLVPQKSNEALGGADFLREYSANPSAVMLDVRTPGEFRAGHIDKAVLIDFENQSFLSEIKKLDPAKTYFVYCRSGNRSGQAISQMKAHGIKNIHELKGGLVSNKEGIPLVTETGL